MTHEHVFHKPLEDQLLEALKQKGEGRLFKKYIQTAHCLKDEILDKIQAKEVQLTDHGPDHVAHVMHQAWKLIQNTDHLSPFDLFILAYSVMFHDTGNLQGRKGHASSIQYALSKCASNLGTAGTRIVSQIVKAHSGSSDPIQRVTPHPPFSSEPINAQEIAALVRFADELAEGERRTSITTLDNLIEDPFSKLHHIYSMCSDVLVVPESKTIMVQYNLSLKAIDGGCHVVVRSDRPDLDCHKIELAEYLDFITQRLNKMNAERRYTGSYCELISSYKRIAYTLNFEGCALDTYSDELNDFVLPNDKRGIPELHEKLMDKIYKTIGGRCAE